MSDIDFDGTPQELVVPATSTSGMVTFTFMVNITDDSVLEFIEQFNVTFDMTDPLPDGVMFGDPNSVTVSLVDDGET